MTKKLHVPNNAPCVFFLEGVGMAALYLKINNLISPLLCSAPNYIVKIEVVKKIILFFLTKVTGVILLLEGDIYKNKFVVENINVYETVTIIILTGYTTNVQILPHNDFKT